MARPSCRVDPTIGYLHTGIEKTAEQKKWQQVIPLVERMDYLGAQSNSLAFCLSVEKLLGIEVPERVKWIRVLLAELQRINSHLVWFGTHAMEVGAISVMLYAFRERELLLNINELLAGFRLFPSYIRVGGLREDMPRGFHERSRPFLDVPGQARRVRGAAHEEHDLPEARRGASAHHRGGRATPTASPARSPARRASTTTCGGRSRTAATRRSSSTCHRRRTATSTTRYLVRVAEMRESVKICRQALERISPTGEWAVDDPPIVPPPKDQVYTEMEALIQHFLIYSQGFTVPAGEAYVPVEGPRGEQGFYVVSDGTNRPWRVKARSPSCWPARRCRSSSSAASSPTSLPSSVRSTSCMGDVDR